MNDERQPKPQSSSPPPRPPRGPVIATGFGDDDEPNERRINLPPKPTAAPNIKLPTFPVTYQWSASAPKKKDPWWKFWK